MAMKEILIGSLIGFFLVQFDSVLNKSWDLQDQNQLLKDSIRNYYLPYKRGFLKANGDSVRAQENLNKFGNYSLN